jgi:hypothetical protein|tara:strand:+ start:103 stop:552 length:450 start_codon:yes stop_codon:yes gene_type:complete
MTKTQFIPVTDTVRQYTEELCEVLGKQYINYSIASQERTLARGEGSEYAVNKLKALKDGTEKNVVTFRVEEGRKYHKIIQVEYDTFQNRNENRDSGVHAFVDKKTGAVYKPASWKSPHTKYVRFNLLDEQSRVDCFNRADWAGGYLYLR